MGYENEPALGEVVELGSDAGRGNLLGVEPYLCAGDYATTDGLFHRLDGYLRQARARGWVSERTIAVLPEYLGTWLVATGAGKGVVSAATLNAAMLRLVLRHGPRFAWALGAAGEKERATAAVFRMRAERMACAYQELFAALARSHGVTLVAGSTILPGPRVEGGRIVPGRGPLYNVSAVFAPDGQAHSGLARKAYPVSSELGFVTPAPVEAMPVFETPAGRLAVLICADSWYPASYARARELGVELLAVPSVISHSGAWAAPWGGYDGAAAPADVDPGDVGRLTEGQAWVKYALAGRMGSAGARAGINVFMRGSLWNLGADSGCGTLVSGETVAQGRGRRGALLNLWL